MYILKALAARDEEPRHGPKPDAASKFQTEPSASIVARFGSSSEPAVSAIGSEVGMAADQLQDRLGPTGIGHLCPTCTQWLRRVLGQQGSSTNDAPGSCCANRPAGTD